MSNVAIEVNGLHKSYKMGGGKLHVLRGVSFSIDKGQFVAVVGASGSGKSTLLHVLGLLDRPDSGQVNIDGVDISKLSAGKRNRMRSSDLGFVFQFYHLLDELSVLENVLLPLKVAHSTGSWLTGRHKARKKAEEILDRVGLSDRLKHRPSELSGGEQQRVAIARAIVNGPKILLADEPTGNLDSKTGSEILAAIKDFCAEQDRTLLMVTHDTSLASQADRVLHLVDGRLSN